MWRGLLIIGLVSLWLAAAVGHAAIRTETIEYRSGETTLEGYLAYDNASRARRPGVLVVHEWWGLNEYPKLRARQLAQLGYVAFAADMYGKGIVATDREQAVKLAGQFREKWDSGGRMLMRQRAQAALNVLARQRLVDRSRLAAIGYCFGGTTVLELAFSGADLAGVVSFHGSLMLPQESDLPQIKAPLLILHGGADTGTKPETIKALMEALDKANADWQFVTFARAKHGFTNPDNKEAYQEKAARRSWEYMRVFLTEVFERR